MNYHNVHPAFHVVLADRLGGVEHMGGPHVYVRVAVIVVGDERFG